MDSTTRVLVVEDDAAQANILAHAFLSAGVREVRRAPDGFVGLREFESFSPDIVVVDVMLPRMNGVSVARKIKERSPSVLVVGYSSVARLRDEESQAFDAWVERRAQTDPAELLEAIRRVASRTRA